MKKKSLLLLIATLFTIIALWRIDTEYLPHNQKDKNTIIIQGNQTINDNLVLSRGTISPGNSPGKITIVGNFSMEPNSTYKCELKDLSGAGSGHDQINVQGGITLSGTLDIILDGYTPNNNDNFQIMKFTTYLSGTFTTINGMPAGWQIDYGIKVPNSITIYGSSNAVPIKLINFYATRQDDKVILNWQTASEENSDYFEIEHSRDGLEFKVVGKIKAQGTSRDIHKYSLSHKNAETGINYYRLKQVDFDGKYTYSDIISLKYEGTTFSFHPNPATHAINLSHPCEVVVIYDLTGKEILRKTNVQSTLDISEIKAGIYLLDINHGEYKQKLVIKK